jgi:2-phosphoglycerate kinase
MRHRAPWQVLLFGGASGVGKTRVSYRLAQHYRVGLTEIDDFQVVLERMTTPEQQPVLHFFRSDPDAFHRMDDEHKLAFAIRYAEVLCEPLELVIANHLNGGAPVVLEGDFLLPALAVRPSYDGIPAGGRVRAVFLYEHDQEQIARNYLAREGAPQPGRARASWRHSEWLRQEAQRLGIPAVAARPWDTVLERVIAALGHDVSGSPSRSQP